MCPLRSPCPLRAHEGGLPSSQHSLRGGRGCLLSPPTKAAPPQWLRTRSPLTLALPGQHVQQRGEVPSGLKQGWKQLGWGVRQAEVTRSVSLHTFTYLSASSGRRGREGGRREGGRPMLPWQHRREGRLSPMPQRAPRGWGAGWRRKGRLLAASIRATLQDRAWGREPAAQGRFARRERRGCPATRDPYMAARLLGGCAKLRGGGGGRSLLGSPGLAQKCSHSGSTASPHYPLGSGSWKSSQTANVQIMNY